MKEVFDKEIIKRFYSSYPGRVDKASGALKRPLTLCEKILYSHLSDGTVKGDFIRGTDYINFNPDRVAMQDATAQMALLQFINAQRNSTAVPVTVHCDHLIIAEVDAMHDIVTATVTNREVYDFLRTVCSKYGMTFWEPGSGIIHQVILENYAFPGGMIIGTDSHTPNAGGLGMMAIGVGGADAVDVMAGMPWELKMPRLIGVKLTGRLNGWASPKDVILKLAGILTVKGATNAVLEYFGEGTTTLSATGKATICNMGAEVGATTSLFPYDSKMYDYLKATGRKSIADMAEEIKNYLKADNEVVSDPEKYYDRVIEIDLTTLEPYINGPFTPDAANTISEFAEIVRAKGFPEKVESGLIGSCTNSSYGDLGRAASLARQAIKKNLEVKSELIINPGSEKVRLTAERDGLLDDLKRIGCVVMANACGPCIGQWKRKNAGDGAPNSIVTSFNRNFAKRNDGNPNTYAFVASPEITTAFSIAGTLCFNPLTDTLTDRDGKAVRLDPPSGNEYPHGGFATAVNGFILPSEYPDSVSVAVNPQSERLQLLRPFEPWDGNDFDNLPLLIKVSGKCTTDHISMAGPWLRYRGHLDNISENLLMGALNAFNRRPDCVLNTLDGSYDRVSAVARKYKEKNIGTVVVAEDNYGEGSSREHAAMEPRFLNVKVILAKSFARIHETNLKKQGMLALTFADKRDYFKIREDDKISITGLKSFTPGRNLTVILSHSDGSVEAFGVAHSYNDLQIKWFRSGSALNNRM
jgi:aconitate hydratase